MATRTLSANKEHVILIQYSLCFKHIGLLKNKRKIEDFRYISGLFFARWLPIWFFIDVGSIWTPFWNAFWYWDRKNGHKKTQRKHTCKKVMQRIPGNPATSPCGPLKGSKDPKIPGLILVIVTVGGLRVQIWSTISKFHKSFEKYCNRSGDLN